MTAPPRWEPDDNGSADDAPPIHIDGIALSDTAREELAPILAKLKQDYDQHAVSSVLSTPKYSRKMTQLAGSDRAWLVAGLTVAGITAKDVAQRFGCSLRLVRSIRADPITQLCVCILTADVIATDVLRSERVDLAAARAEACELARDNERLQMKLDQILDKLVTTGRVDTFPRCGHPNVKWNTYEHDGRKRCLKCRSDWQAKRRKALAQA